ncbi:MAG TPA: PmoA family protein [Planctomycetaceae bacterium]
MPAPLPRCRVVPMPDDQVAFIVDGVERTRWHFGARHPGPFFYPLAGPSGEPLTRMGHPGAPNHDHHRSVWLGHEKVAGVDFWSHGTAARIRQHQWLAYQSGDDEAVMAVRLGWFDGHDPRELVTQDLVVAVRPGDGGETLVELHATFLPTSETLEFGRTNFGPLGVRVAESISVHFGGGTITGSDGGTGERDLFGLPNRWMDYSGPVRTGDRGEIVAEGITLFDHPSNPNHPAKWHVREDGWMGPSLCRDAPVVTSRGEPLAVRYLLHAHGGPVDPGRAEEIFRDFAARPGFTIERSRRPHQAFEVRRA